MRRDAIASQASRNAAGGLRKPPFGSRNPASPGVDDPRRSFGIASGPSPTEKPGYGIVWVPYVRFYPLGWVRLEAPAFRPFWSASLAGARPGPPRAIPGATPQKKNGGRAGNWRGRRGGSVGSFAASGPIPTNRVRPRSAVPRTSPAVLPDGSSLWAGVLRPKESEVPPERENEN